MFLGEIEIMKTAGFSRSFRSHTSLQTVVNKKRDRQNTTAIRQLLHSTYDVNNNGLSHPPKGLEKERIIKTRGPPLAPKIKSVNVISHTS